MARLRAPTPGCMAPPRLYTRVYIAAPAKCLQHKGGLPRQGAARGHHPAGTTMFPPPPHGGRALHATSLCPACAAWNEVLPEYLCGHLTQGGALAASLGAPLFIPECGASLVEHLWAALLGGGAPHDALPASYVYPPFPHPAAFLGASGGRERRSTRGRGPAAAHPPLQKDPATPACAFTSRGTRPRIT